MKNELYLRLLAEAEMRLNEILASLPRRGEFSAALELRRVEMGR
jgi:hypothetical protein